MPHDPADGAILAVSMVAALFGITMLGTGEVAGLGSLLVGALGFAYLKADFDGLGRRDGTGDDAAGQENAEDPLTVLRDRYARGEIDRAEFERRLDDLLETDPAEAWDDRRDEPILRERER